MATLYELGDAYSDLLAQLEMCETEEEAGAIYDQLDKLEEDLTLKAEAYARIMRNKLTEAEMFKAEKQRMERNQKSAQAVADRLKARLLDTMQRLGVQDIQTGIGKWRLQANPWSCTVISEDEVPEEFRIPQPDKIDSKAIIDHFKATGELIPGVEVQQSMGIRFR